jgi:hypothetical protein
MPSGAIATAAATFETPLGRALVALGLRRVGQRWHTGWINHHVPEWPRARALAAQFVFVAQRNVNHAAFPAVQGIEPEWCPGVFYFFGGCLSADAQFFNAQSPIVIRVERDAGVIVGVQPQGFLRDQFECEEQLGAIGQKHFDVTPLKFYDEIGVFEIGMAVIPGFDCEIEIEIAAGDELTEKLFDPRTRFVNRILGIQALFLPSFNRLLRGNHLDGTSRFVEEPLLGYAAQIASEPV